MTEAARDRIVQALTAETSPLRDEGVTLALDYLLGVPMAELLDVATIRSIVVRALTAENVGRVIQSHVEPGFDRYGVHARASRETVGDLMSPASREAVRAIVHASEPPPAAWAEGMLDPVLLRKLFAPVWANVLMSFAKRLPIPGAGMAQAAATQTAVGRGALGIAERLTRSVQDRAEKIVDAGRSVMGGLGAELERRFQTAAREFSDGAADIFKEALKDRLKSDEGKDLVRKLTDAAFDHVMKTELGRLHADTESVPMADVFRAVPEIVLHAKERPFIVRIVDREIEAFVAVEGKRSLADLLSEAGILDETRTASVGQMGALARGLAATPAFGDWVLRLLQV